MRLALVLGLALVGCGSSEPEEDPAPTPAPASSARASGGESFVPEAVLGKATVPETLHADGVDEVLQRRVGYVRMCYVAALADDPGLKGELVLRLTIDARGEVEEVGVPSATLKNFAVEDCLERGMKGLRFPAPTKAPAMVDVPLTFTLEAAAK